MMIRMKFQPLLACCLLGILLSGCAQNQPAVAEAAENKTDEVPKTWRISNRW